MPIKLLAMEIRVLAFLFGAFAVGISLAGCEGNNKGQTAAQIYEESMRTEALTKKKDIKELGIPIAAGAEQLGPAVKVGVSLHIVFMTPKPLDQVRQFYVKELKGEVTKQGGLTIVKGKNENGQTTYATLRQVPDETEISITLFDPGEPEATMKTP